MIAEAFWTSATRTNTNSRRRLLRSYEAFVLLLEPDLETAASPTEATRTRQRRKRCERGTEAR